MQKKYSYYKDGFKTWDSINNVDLWTTHRWSWGNIFPHGLYLKKKTSFLQPCHKELQKKKWLRISQVAKKTVVLKNILKSSGKLCCVGWGLLKFQRNTVHFILGLKETTQSDENTNIAQCAALLVGLRCVWHVDFVDNLLRCLALWTDLTGSYTFKALNEFTCEMYNWNGLTTK